MKHLTVGEMARLNHISEQTLRLYDKRGLLSPSFRGENGYRYYDIKQSAVLDIIQYMKSLGISLKEIGRQLENRDLGRIEAALREKQRQTEEEIRLLKCQRRALERTVESFARWRAAPPDGTVQMEYIGARQMYVVDSGVNVYAHDVETYEEMLRDLKDSLVKDRLPQIYFCNAGTRMAQSDFRAGQAVCQRGVRIRRQGICARTAYRYRARGQLCLHLLRRFLPGAGVYRAPARVYPPKQVPRLRGLFVRIYCRHPRGRAKRPRAVPAGCRCLCSSVKAARAGEGCARGPKNSLNFYRISQLDLIPRITFTLKAEGGLPPKQGAPRARAKKG